MTAERSAHDTISAQPKPFAGVRLIVPSRYAFSLIELLVIMGIVGILAALVFTAVTGVKQRSQETVCLGNLRQIGFGLKLYQSDYQNRLPLVRCMRGSTGKLPVEGTTGNDWWELWETLGGKDPDHPTARIPLAKERPLFPYVRTSDVFHCPADKGWEDSARGMSTLPNFWSEFGCSYYYNSSSNRRGRPIGIRPSWSDVAAPALSNKDDDSLKHPSKL